MGLSPTRRPSPAQHAESQSYRGNDEGDHRHQVGGEVEARALGQREYRRAVLSDQRVLDFSLGLAFDDQAFDQDALALGLWRFGQLQQGAADRAHHFAFDVVDVRLRRRRQRRGERDYQGKCQHKQRTGRVSHA
ncbi:MAG TPA: hypothetical protein VIM28_09055 [Solirubrobacterales bacterium]